jgi:hypothetical protein
MQPDSPSQHYARLSMATDAPPDFRAKSLRKSPVKTGKKTAEPNAGWFRPGRDPRREAGWFQAGFDYRRGRGPRVGAPNAGRPKSRGVPEKAGRKAAEKPAGKPKRLRAPTEWAPLEPTLSVSNHQTIAEKSREESRAHAEETAEDIANSVADWASGLSNPERSWRW